jgi:hypothetical protein
MPTSPIIIIGGSGGGNRTQAAYGIGYPVVSGDAAENTAISGPDIYCVLVNAAMQTTDIYISPGDKYTFIEAGAFTVP